MLLLGGMKSLVDLGRKSAYTEDQVHTTAAACSDSHEPSLVDGEANYH